MADVRFLHLHSTFSAGGKELRSVQLINALGPGIEHSIVSAESGHMEATSLLSREALVAYPEGFPELHGLPTPGRLHRIARAMRGFDLILTYNWGAIDATMAHMLYGDHLGLAPLVHHEDGFNEDEQHRLKVRRNWYRRIALARASRLVVPSETLEAIALERWHIPFDRVVRIPNGVDTAAFTRAPRGNILPGVRKRDGDLWVGTMAGLREVKNLPALVRCFAGLPEPWRLVIVGEGPEEPAIRAEAARLGISERVHLPGFVPDPAKFAALFDIFALASHSEQFPISVVEAMAAGVAVVAPNVGDIAAMVAEENRPFVVPAEDEPALTQRLNSLAADPAARRMIGDANRAKATASFDAQIMIASYSRLYSRAMSKNALP